ncbi:MAG: hypothetical protein K2Q01_09905 [Rickettsiales bacterium]|nr:hypothetical protein [Rickettsiales bacterium]
MASPVAPATNAPVTPPNSPPPNPGALTTPVNSPAAPAANAPAPPNPPRTPVNTPPRTPAPAERPTPWEIIQKGLEKTEPKVLRAKDEGNRPYGYEMNFATAEEAKVFSKALEKVGLDGFVATAPGEKGFNVTVSSAEGNAGAGLDKVIDLVAELNKDGMPQRIITGRTLETGEPTPTGIRASNNLLQDRTPLQAFENPVGEVERAMRRRFSNGTPPEVYAKARAMMTESAQANFAVDYVNYGQMRDEAARGRISPYNAEILRNTEAFIKKLEGVSQYDSEGMLRAIGKEIDLRPPYRPGMRRLQLNNYAVAYDTLLNDAAKSQMLSPADFEKYSKLLETSNDTRATDDARQAAKDEIAIMQDGDPKVDV